MLSFQQQLTNAKRPPSKVPVERQICATDAEIDRLVFELYDLTEEEMEIVVGGAMQLASV
jgi:hypothetical protein